MKNTTIKLFPCDIDGEVSAVSSKSISHRAIIAASLSKGKSVISNILYSEDILATIESLKELGIKFIKDTDKLTIYGSNKLKYSNNPVNCNESGSTLRFLIPLFSVFNEKVIFTGKESLISRPQTIYQDLYKEDGNEFKITKDKIMVNGFLKPKKYLIDGSVSSQFISGLLFALPLLSGDSEIILSTPLESKGYVNLTISVLESFGINITVTNNGFYIEGNQRYIARNFNIEGDYSQAAFFLVAGLISKRVKINNINIDSLQGDKEILSFIKAMKGKVTYTENGFITTKCDTYQTVIDISQTPDLAPPIALLAALSNGETKIINASRLRAKESDRIKAIVTTLSTLGANIKEVKDSIIINGVDIFEGNVTVDSFNDHRIAMMVSIASSRIKLPVILTRANAVNKSYPTFFDDFKLIGGNYNNLKD